MNNTPARDGETLSDDDALDRIILFAKSEAQGQEVALVAQVERYVSGLRGRDREVASPAFDAERLNDEQIADIRARYAAGRGYGEGAVIVKLCDEVAALRAECARLTAERDTVKRLQRSTVSQFDPVARCVERLRESIEQASGSGLPLHDALIGQRSDSTFWTQWERNKASLRALLDALDEAFPLTQTMARAAAPTPGEGETTDEAR